ncbi:unnamed protein product [Parnassius mnemosyne]|uniref:Reverse transcriptase domain-containing protein n=1 Tax=Parnassius mnemosyne TaxID=213953 RepID=A0AAV1LJK3_9NEOP
MAELTVKCLLYADDQVILASSVAELQMMVTLMNRTLKEKGMKVNAKPCCSYISSRYSCSTNGSAKTNNRRDQIWFVREL